jgi:hypothetical protein
VQHQDTNEAARFRTVLRDTLTDWRTNGRLAELDPRHQILALNLVAAELRRALDSGRVMALHLATPLPRCRACAGAPRLGRYDPPARPPEQRAHGAERRRTGTPWNGVTRCRVGAARTSNPMPFANRPPVPRGCMLTCHLLNARQYR